MLSSLVNDDAVDLDLTPPVIHEGGQLAVAEEGVKGLSIRDSTTLEQNFVITNTSGSSYHGLAQVLYPPAPNRCVVAAANHYLHSTYPVHIIDIESKERLLVLDPMHGSCRALTNLVLPSTEKSVLVAAAYDAINLVVDDLETGERLRRIDAYSGKYTFGVIHVSEWDANSVFVGSAEFQSVRQVEVEKGTIVQHYDLSPDKNQQSCWGALTSCPRMNLVVCGVMSSFVHLWDHRNSSSSADCDVKLELSGATNSLFAVEDKHLILAGVGGRIEVFDVRNPSTRMSQILSGMRNAALRFERTAEETFVSVSSNRICRWNLDGRVLADAELPHNGYSVVLLESFEYDECIFDFRENCECKMTLENSQTKTTQN